MTENFFKDEYEEFNELVGPCNRCEKVDTETTIRFMKLAKLIEWGKKQESKGVHFYSLETCTSAPASVREVIESTCKHIDTERVGTFELDEDDEWYGHITLTESRCKICDSVIMGQIGRIPKKI